MTAVGQHLRLRLFLEGVEVPVVSATIQSQKNAAAVASIQIPANDLAMDIRPRTLVHLFAYDAYRGAPPEQQVYVDGAGIKSKPVADPEASSIIPPEIVKDTPEQSQTDLENENYKLVFGGEVMAIQYQKTPSSRGVVLQCADWSSYWDIAYQYQLNGFSFGGGGIKAAFTGASTTVFNNFLEGSGDIVKNLIETAPRSYPSLKGSLLGGVTNLIESIGGVYYGNRAIKGTNDFFSLAEMRLHLTQQIGANPDSQKDEMRLLSAHGFGSMFSKTLGGLGRLVTVRQVLLALQKYIFHEIVPMTSPRYVPPLTEPGVTKFETVGLLEDPTTAVLAKAATAIRTSALELTSRQTSARDLQLAASASAAKGGLQKELLKLATAASEAQKRARTIALKQGSGDSFGLAEVTKNFETSSRQFITLLGAVRKGTTGLFEFPLVDTAAAKTVLRILEEIAAAMQRVLESKHRRAVKKTFTQPDPPARLLTQIYRPDVWMVAPPRCNVLFPELYSQFSYGRNFQAEVSRLLLRTHEAFYGSDILFDGFYMAPSRILGARNNKPMQQGRTGREPDLSDAPAWVLKDMMEHELFTGIVPAFERMSDLNLHAIRGGSIEINGAKVGYAQLACNHIFFQHRFRSRELMLQGKFNPYFALGFPAVVLDKYLSNDQLKAGGYDIAIATRIAEGFKETADLALPLQDQQLITEVSAAKVNEILGDLIAQQPNTHYLGTPEMVSHSLSANMGGTTNIQMGYARSTNERTEFLGDNIGQSSKAKRVRNFKIPTVVAAFEAPKTGTVGVRGGNIVDVKDVTDRYQKKQPKKAGRTATGHDRYKSSTTLPLFVGGYQAGRVRRGTQVAVGIEQAASAYGPEVVALVGSGGATIASTSDVLVTFRAYEITEEVGSYVTEDVELPPEDLTFPPWYGEAYRTNRIGGLYSYFFGVGAITDPTTILGGSAPRNFGGDDTSRSLVLQLQNKLAEGPATTAAGGSAVARPGQMPMPGTNSIPEPPGGGAIGPAGEPDVLGDVGAHSNLAMAIEEIVKAYSATRSQNFDTPQFVQNYTWRPIASLVDLFGTASLEIDDDGNVVAGREGFHSRAFGDVDNLRQLVASGDTGLQKILGLNVAPRELSTDKEEKDAAISSRLDTRKEKRMSVYRYLSALAASRGVVLG